MFSGIKPPSGILKSAFKKDLPPHQNLWCGGLFIYLTPRVVFSSYKGVILSKAKDLYRSFSPLGFRMRGRETPRPLIYLIILGSFLYLGHLTWLKWGDLIIDSGREMYIPLALSEGKLLYRDISYFYGPLTPYLHALLFKIFSPHLKYLIFSGLVTTLLSAIFIYKISRIFLETIPRILSTLTFLFVFAFGKYMYVGIFNFILPYTYSATYSILFALIALYLFIRFVFSQKKGYVFGYSLFLSLSLLCRIEIGLSLLGTFVLSLIVCRLVQRKEFKIFFPLYFPLFLTFLIFIVGFSFLLFEIGSFTLLKNNFLNTYFYFTNFDKNNIFVITLAGYNAPLKNILLLGKSFLAYIFLTAFLGLGSHLLQLSFSKKFKEKTVNLLAFLGLFLIIFTIFISRGYFRPTIQYRSLPLICIFIIVFFLGKLLILKRREEIKKDISLLALSLFSWLSLLRIILNVQAGHYGFYLLIPGMVLYYIFFLKLVPDFLKYKNPIFNGALVIFFIFLIMNHLSLSRFIYSKQTLKIETERGTLYSFNNNREKRCQELIDFLEKNTHKEDKLVVFPEGVALNFLSQRENPLSYYHFLPCDLAIKEVEDKIIQQLAERKVNYIAIVQRSTAEYGYPAFGLDYAQKLYDWIKINYKAIKLFGPPPFSSEDFGIVLLERISP